MALLGKADSTLVQGAYNVAAANVPGDMSKIYKQREKNIKDLTEGIQKAWDSQFEAYNALETRITEGSDLAIANVLEGKTNDSMLAAVDNEVRAIKAEMQTFNKRDKGNLEWKKLEARVNKLATTSKNNDAAWSSLIDLSANGDLHIAGTGPEVNLYEALINDYNNNTNFTNGKIVDGDFVYSLPGNPDVTMTMQQLKKNLMIKDDTAPNNIMTVVNGVMKASSTTDRPWDDEYQSDTRNLIRNHLKTANDRTNVIHHRFPGMKNSIYDYLDNPSLNPELTAEIHSALLTLDTDIDNDGKTDDVLTYTNNKNINFLKKYIINNANSQDFLANVLTDVIGENSYGRGKDVKQETENNNKTKYIYNPGDDDDDDDGRPKNEVITFVDEKGDNQSMKSNTIYDLQDRMTNIMNSGNKNQIIPFRGTNYQWLGSKEGWVEVERKGGKYYYIDDDNKNISKNKARKFRTIQNVFDEHGVPIQGGGTSTNKDYYNLVTDKKK